MNTSIEDLTYKYGGFEALHGVTASFRKGAIHALLGSNGAGKTTLLRCLAGLSVPKSGKILYDGQSFSRKRMDLRKRIMFLTDFPICYPEMTVMRHIGMFLKVYETDETDIIDRVLETLRDFDLLPLAQIPIMQLSRGQAYKAALVTLIAVNPDVWLLDEPFASGMDPLGIVHFKKYARDAAANGRTVIYSTQILDVAESLSDTACILDKGAIYACDSLETLRRNAVTGANILETIFLKLRQQ